MINSHSSLSYRCITFYFTISILLSVHISRSVDLVQPDTDLKAFDSTFKDNRFVLPTGKWEWDIIRQLRHNMTDGYVHFLKRNRSAMFQGYDDVCDAFEQAFPHIGLNGILMSLTRAHHAEDVKYFYTILPSKDFVPSSEPSYRHRKHSEAMKYFFDLVHLVGAWAVERCLFDDLESSCMHDLNEVIGSKFFRASWATQDSTLHGVVWTAIAVHAQTFHDADIVSFTNKLCTGHGIKAKPCYHGSGHGMVMSVVLSHEGKLRSPYKRCLQMNWMERPDQRVEGLLAVVVAKSSSLCEKMWIPFSCFSGLYDMAARVGPVDCNTSYMPSACFLFTFPFITARDCAVYSDDVKRYCDAVALVFQVAVFLNLSFPFGPGWTAEGLSTTLASPRELTENLQKTCLSQLHSLDCWSFAMESLEIYDLDASYVSEVRRLSNVSLLLPQAWFFSPSKTFRTLSHLPSIA